MTVTLYDMVFLLDLPITGRLIEERDLAYEHGIFLLETELLFMSQDAMKECKDQWGVFFSYTHLKRCYEGLLNRCNQLLDPADVEEAEEHSVVRTACIKAFLLLLLGYTIFAARTI